MSDPICITVDTRLGRLQTQYFFLLSFSLSLLLVSVGHRVKIHKITPAVGNERGDIEIKDYDVFPRGHDNYLPPRPLILDFTMMHDHYGRSHVHPTGKLTHAGGHGVPQPDDALKHAVRLKIPSL